MRNYVSRHVLPLFLLTSFVTGQTPTPDPWKNVEQAMGRSGQAQPDGAYKFSMPRKDLSVTVAGVQVKPGLALGSWAAFNNPGKHALVMGEDRKSTRLNSSHMS